MQINIRKWERGANSQGENRLSEMITEGHEQISLCLIPSSLPLTRHNRALHPDFLVMRGIHPHQKIAHVGRQVQMIGKSTRIAVATIASLHGVGDIGRKVHPLKTQRKLVPTLFVWRAIGSPCSENSGETLIFLKIFINVRKEKAINKLKLNQATVIATKKKMLVN